MECFVHSSYWGLIFGMVIGVEQDNLLLALLLLQLLSIDDVVASTLRRSWAVIQEPRVLLLVALH